MDYVVLAPRNIGQVVQKNRVEYSRCKILYYLHLTGLSARSVGNVVAYGTMNSVTDGDEARTVPWGQQLKYVT